MFNLCTKFWNKLLTEQHFFVIFIEWVKQTEVSKHLLLNTALPYSTQHSIILQYAIHNITLQYATTVLYCSMQAQYYVTVCNHSITLHYAIHSIMLQYATTVLCYSMQPQQKYLLETFVVRGATNRFSGVKT